jgi:hypothetical protein
MNNEIIKARSEILDIYDKTKNPQLREALMPSLLLLKKLSYKKDSV